MGKDVVADVLISRLMGNMHSIDKESCIGYARKFVEDLLPAFENSDAKDSPMRKYNDRTYRDTVIGVVDSILKCDQLALSRHLVSLNNPNDTNIYVIPDCRRKIEGDFFRENLGDNAMFVKVERPSIAIDSNAYGEGDMDDFDWDYTIVNDGTVLELMHKAEDLSNIVDEIVQNKLEQQIGEKQYV